MRRLLAALIIVPSLCLAQFQTKDTAQASKIQALDELQATKGDVTCGEIGAIVCGQTVTGSLNLTLDCTLTDGTAIDQYSFNATAGQTITADLMSQDFDAYLFLTDTDFTALAQDDDSGAGQNSRIVYEFATSGEVFLLPNSFTPPQEGDYSLSVTCTGGNETEQYSLHEHWSQILWNPGLNGWGFAFDIQKGVLFGAVYGYDNAGDPTFYTLISDKVSANAVFNFAGDVFRTIGNGTNTSDVGNFTFDLIPINGQPGGRLTMTSPSANFSNLQLIRFGFLDSDELSILSGQLATLAAVAVQEITDQAGGIMLFGNDRILISGETGIPITTANPNAAGFFYYDSQTLEYVVLLTSTTNTNTLMLEGVVADHKDMSGFGTILTANGTPLTGQALFRISALGADVLSTKALRDKVVSLPPTEKQIESAISAYRTWRWKQDMAKERQRGEAN